MRVFVLGAVWLVAAVAGFSAWRINRGVAESGTWRAAAASMVTGTVVGVVTFLVLCAIALVASVIAFEHSGFVW